MTMDHGYIEEHNLVERYVLGRLSAAEQARFEDHFAGCEECLAGLEAAEDLRDGLRRTAATEVVRAGLLAALLRRLGGPRVLAGFAALALVALAPALWLSLENRRLRGELDGLSRPLAGVPSLRLQVVRASETDAGPVLRPPPSAEWLEIAVELDSAAAESSYRATLVGADGGTRWRGDGLTADPWGVVRITFPARFLPAGGYRLELEPEAEPRSSGPRLNFPFRVAPPK